MIKLKSLLREATYAKFWWMSPEGKLVRIFKLDPQTGHRESAIELLSAMGHNPEKDVFKQMYDLDWLRVAFKGDRGNYQVEFNTNHGHHPNHRQVDALKDLAQELQDKLDENEIEYRDFELLDATNGKRYPFGKF